MGKPIISGIQQVGIGVSKVYDAFAWYRKHFGMDIPMFDEAAEAGLMLPYTGGQPRSRHAILAINIQGGGGMEIWQYTSRTPEAPAFRPQLGDLGIFIAKIKSKDIEKTYNFLKAKNCNLLSEINTTPEGKKHFFLKDPYGNIFEVVPSNDWFSSNQFSTGGMFGAVIGVSNIEQSLKLYSDVLGYDQVVYDKEDSFEDFGNVPGAQNKCRRVLLRHATDHRKGAFSKMLGSSEIELVQLSEGKPRKIFENRFWGDLGYIHLCFDINGMPELKKKCEDHGFPFTVDSSESFDMGEAAGHFTYIEDPDGTLIEFVETHKIPIMKKIRWYLDLRKRNPEKPLPNWMLKTLALNRVKD